MQNRINAFLEQQLVRHCPNDSKLKSAMAYSLLSGGKRMRPLLVYATAESIDVDLVVADYIAAAIEMIHAYSLIHDDLPAMDNDDLRRGKPTNHIAFDYATAILAGDALQSMAFATLAKCPVDPLVCINLISSLAHASGIMGMAGGQSLDLISEDLTANLDELETIHAAKTGALLKSCVTLTIQTKQSITTGQHKLFRRFADNFGLAFQIIDDVLDVTQDTDTLGKPANSDTKNKKSTYPGLMGIEAAKQKASNHIDEAYQSLAALPYACGDLFALTDWVLRRNH